MALCPGKRIQVSQGYYVTLKLGQAPLDTENYNCLLLFVIVVVVVVVVVVINGSTTFLGSSCPPFMLFLKDNRGYVVEQSLLSLGKSPPQESQTLLLSMSHIPHLFVLEEGDGALTVHSSVF